MVYDRGQRRWAFTEPAAGTTERATHRFAASGSTLRREGKTLLFELDEHAAPFGGHIRGRVRLDVRHGAPEPFALDAAGRHHWWPVGASARAEIELDEPDLRFEGSAYHDCNFGSRPLETDFEGWDWSRTDLGPETQLTYDVRQTDGHTRQLALRVGPQGVSTWSPDEPVELPRPRWGMPRSVRAEPGTVIQSVRTLEDSPFYTRTALRSQQGDRAIHTMHESLSMTQFVKPWVRFLLPFRMRRGWRA